MKHMIAKIGLAVLTGMICLLTPHMTAQAEGIVVVVDPGHGGVGGTNEGAQYNGVQEKNLTLTVANAMVAELSKYEGITVYQTRNSDVEMSLAARANYAQSVGADFLFSIHFNASSEHNYFGSEVWVPSTGNNYARGYSFGLLAEEELGGLGIYSKGVKTKLGKSGDYYGIIRNSTAKGITSAIIEHCYLDNDRDKDFYHTNADLIALGKADATAVAKFYGLKSTILGVDYSAFARPQVAAPSKAVGQDTTAPAVCSIKQVLSSESSSTATVTLTTSDSESKIIYYDYSTNGGITFSPLCMFQCDGDSANISISVSNRNADVVFRVYNQYELMTTSNHITLQ